MSTLIGRCPAVAIAVRCGVSVTLALSGLIHAQLYVHGYRHISTIGTGFLVQASVFVALAVLIGVGGPHWLQTVAGLTAAGSLVAFALSRTTGVFGFVERGWEPAPQAVVSVVAEVLTVVLCAFSVARSFRVSQRHNQLK